MQIKPSKNFKSLVKLIKLILPPFIFSLIKFILLKLNLVGNVEVLSNKKFINWWHNFKNTPNLKHIDKDIISMLDNFIESNMFKNSSSYWKWLCKNHIEMIEEYGVENFKLNIEKSAYWGEGNLDSEQIKQIIKNEITINLDISEVFRQKNEPNRTAKETIHQNLSNIILLNYLVNNNYQKYLHLVEENEFGNPQYIKYENRRYSFGILNSILEIGFLDNNTNFNQNINVLEIGAGSGRTCIALKGFYKVKKYVIVDIPPALFISEKNIKASFPEKKIFSFTNFIDFKTVEQDFTNADVCFISPDQIKMMPNKFFDLSIAVDCLHEMSFSDVKIYFSEINRISSHFYLKAQITQSAKYGEHELNRDDYPIYKSWTKIADEECIFPNDYFQSIYKIM